MINLKTKFKAANVNDINLNIVAKIYVLLKTPAHDPLMIMGDPKLNHSFVIKLTDGQDKKDILKQAQKKMSVDTAYDATIMLCDAAGKWSYKATNMINSRFDVMDVIAKQLHQANQAKQIQIKDRPKALDLNAA